jgi:carbonic anhydrase/acetyltransferase-like protein (isoleucine patch superfamily)
LNLLTQLVQTPRTGGSRIASALNTLWLKHTYPFVSMGQDAWIHHSCKLERSMAPYIVIGEEVMLKRGVWLNIPESPASDQPIIVLEGRCNLGPRCILSAQNLIHIGRNTIFGPGVFVADHNHGFEDVTQPIRDQGTTAGGKIRIGQDCWIGYGAALVCSGGVLELGDHCVVAANALVTRSFPAYSVIAGNPARVVKQFDPIKNAWVMGSARAVDAVPNG